jgi:NifU-like protein involved in Fe-S cluster formation
VLGLATSLAAYPWNESLPLKGWAKSRTCGSTISLGLSTDEAGRIEQVALKSQACAIGQAAASIFAKAAPGRTGKEIHEAEAAVSAWLAGERDIPDWPGLEAIAAARDYPARHGAIMLAWRAARDILPSE